MAFNAWVSWPNRITITRILLVGPFVICLLHQKQWGEPGRWLAAGIFAVMAFSDFLDGFLARRLQSETPLGKFLDPLADKLLVVCAVILLARQDSCVPGERLWDWAVVAAIGKDLLVVAGFLVVYVAVGQVFIQPRRIGKACTLLQMAGVMAVLLAPELRGLYPPLRGVPKALWLVATALAIAASLDYIRTGMRFAATAGQPSSDRPSPTGQTEE